MKPNRISAKNIDAYIATMPRDTQAILQKIRSTIHQAVPEAEETISYCMPSFRRHGALVYFAAFNEHIGFYPTTSAIRKFRRELGRYDLAKGTVRFPYGSAIPYGLIVRIAKFRALENSAKAAAKRKKK